jgi:stage V sporulation protein G
MNCQCPADCSLDGLVITSVYVKLADEPGERRLRAFCTVVLNDAVAIHDLRVIEGSKGPFVAMPSRKVCDRCKTCGGKNNLQARYCGHCGWRLDESRVIPGLCDSEGRPKLHADVAHPVHEQARRWIEDHVLEAYYDAINARDGVEPDAAYQEAC